MIHPFPFSATISSTSQPNAATFKATVSLPLLYTIIKSNKTRYLILLTGHTKNTTRIKPLIIIRTLNQPPSVIQPQPSKPHLNITRNHHILIFESSSLISSLKTHPKSLQKKKKKTFTHDNQYLKVAKFEHLISNGHELKFKSQLKPLLNLNWNLNWIDYVINRFGD